MKPLVSIVTPSYNQGKFLERTIVSVLSQDYPNIEYIVMDGGSNDNSVEIIKKYSNKIKFWVSEKDKGQSDAINKGWKMATGQYCSYLNSDDELAPGAVTAIMDAFLKDPSAGTVYGDYTFIDGDNGVLEKGKGHQTDFKRLLVNGQMPAIAQPSSFYRMDLIRKVNYIDESLHLSMDYDLLLKLAKNAPMVYIPATISLFRLHGNAKSSTLAKKHWKETLKVIMRYSTVHSWKAWMLYTRFRIFSLLPTPVQNVFRRGRNSVNDKLILGNKE